MTTMPRTPIRKPDMPSSPAAHSTHPKQATEAGSPTATDKARKGYRRRFSALPAGTLTTPLQQTQPHRQGRRLPILRLRFASTPKSYAKLSFHSPAQAVSIGVVPACAARNPAICPAEGLVCFYERDIKRIAENNARSLSLPEVFRQRRICL